MDRALRARLIVSDSKARAERTPHPLAQSVQESVVGPHFGARRKLKTKIGAGFEARTKVRPYTPRVVSPINWNVVGCGRRGRLLLIHFDHLCDDFGNLVPSEATSANRASRICHLGFQASGFVALKCR